MAEDTSTNTNANPTPKAAAKTATAGAGNKFTMYIIIGLIVLLITVMIMATVLITTFSNLKAPQTIVKTVPSAPVQSEEVGLWVPLGEMIINLYSDDPATAHYLKINITLEVAKDEKIKEEITDRVPEIKDLIISIIRATTIEKIEEKEGKELLRSEILNKLKGKFTTKITDIYCEDFLVQ